MAWFERDFDHPLYFEIYRNKEGEASEEGPALAAYLGLSPGSRVLDLPCGWGRLTPHFRARGWRLVGGDLSPRNLHRHQECLGGELVRLDLRSLPFQSHCADGVMCAFTSWGYFATDAENLVQLREFRRVLKTGGALLLDLAGRHFLERAIGMVEHQWYEVDGYRERVRWSADRRRIRTDRILQGVRFQHDIWIPDEPEILGYLKAAGFTVEAVWGGLHGEPWNPQAERWIFRAVATGSGAV